MRQRLRLRIAHIPLYFISDSNSNNDNNNKDEDGDETSAELEIRSHILNVLFLLTFFSLFAFFCFVFAYTQAFSLRAFHSEESECTHSQHSHTHKMSKARRRGEKKRFLVDKRKVDV